MATQEDLENRQFQLERLSEEGKPLCEEIHKNNEELLFSAEDLDMDDEMLDALGEVVKEEAEQLKPQEISRRQFIIGVHGMIDYWNRGILKAQKEILKAQLEILKADKVLVGERAHRALNARLKYYLNPDGSYSFQAREKEPVGFKPPPKVSKRKMKEARTWLEAFKERQAKKHEGERAEAQSN